jgi:hypothetical protein
MNVANMTETAISHGFAAGFQFIAAAELGEFGIGVSRLAFGASD